MASPRYNSLMLAQVEAIARDEVATLNPHCRVLVDNARLRSAIPYGERDGYTLHLEMAGCRASHWLDADETLWHVRCATRIGFQTLAGKLAAAWSPERGSR